jgi:hypothetical protein
MKKTRTKKSRDTVPLNVREGGNHFGASDDNEVGVYFIYTSFYMLLPSPNIL